MKKMPLLLASASLFIALCTVAADAAAQKEPIVMEVGGDQIGINEFKAEFMNAEGKRLAADPKTTDAEKRRALREYAELYANFRAKLLDAHNLGLDTADELLLELKQYRAELAAPYLIDSAVLQAIFKEAYERNRYSLHAAHILRRLPPDADPEDTARVYRHIMELRDRILAGEDFYAVARESAYGKDPDPNVVVRQNEGDLGYFTAFDMTYPFENAVYAMKVGDLSMPVRTKYGYHIIKLFDKVELQRNLDVAHIWVNSPDSLAGRGRIYEYYNRLKGGTDFAMVARNSDDRTSADNGGLLKDATLNSLMPEYLHRLEHLKPGEYSEPFHTRYGWHIVQMVRRDTLAPLEEMIPHYKQRMSRDPRGEASRHSFARSCREKYGFVDLTKEPIDKDRKKAQKGKPARMKANLDELYAIVPVEATRRMWKYNDTMVTDIHPILQTPDREYTTLDLARYIASHQNAERPLKPTYFVDMQYQNFIDSVAIAFADKMLENEYPEFAAIVKEYRRGLLIFNYNSRMIWTKALFDTVGMADFYRRESATKRLENPDDSLYFWHTRARVVLFGVSDSTCLPTAKAAKIIRNAQKKGKGSKEMGELLEKGMGKLCAGVPVSAEPDVLEQTRQRLLAADQWVKGLYFIPDGKGYKAVLVEEVLPPSLKSQAAARGYYLSGYQNELEQRLNGELRRKYNVKINWDVVGTIAY